MRLTSLPLRILLAVALVINAMGGAVAGVAGTAALGHAEADLVQVATTPSDCGGHPTDHPAVPEPQRPAPASGHPCPSAGEDACTDDAQCRQACTHACVALPQRVSIGVQLDSAQPPHPFTRGHPSPPSRSPIRPPIA